MKARWFAAGGARRPVAGRFGIAVAAVWLAACGGGGGGGSEPPPVPSPNAQRLCVGGEPGWCWQSPLPSVENVRVVRFFDARFGMVAGDAGYLQKTLDGGETWTRLPRTDFGFLDVAMASASRGWARGTNDLLLFSTRDGGVTWDRSAITLPNGQTVPQGLTRVLPLGDERLVLSSAGNAEALLTEDGGATWTLVPRPDTPVQPDGLYWSAPTHRLRGLPTEYARYWRATRFGRESQSMEGLPESCVAKLLPIDRERLRAHCSKADLVALGTIRLFQSNDGGLHWTPLPADLPAVNGASWTLTDVALDAAGDGFGILRDELPDGSQRVRLLRASAGASLWRPIDNLPPALAGFALPDKPVIDDRSLWLVDAAAQAWWTDDRGSTWRRIAVPQEAGRPALLARDASGALQAEYHHVLRDAAGDVILGPMDRRFYRSSDGGQRWWRVPGDRGPDPLTSVEGLWFHDARNGLALLSDGSLRSTDDGGRSWQKRAADGPPPACCGRTGLLQFGSATHGWMLVGGVLKATSDGGRSFSSVAGLPAELQSVADLQFIDAQNGWAVGAGGRLHASRDGGRSWTPAPQPAGAAQRVHFIDARNGVLLLRDGSNLDAVWHTADGGLSWTRTNFSGHGGEDIVALRHADAQNVWMVGTQAYPHTENLWHSSDGGRSWRNATPAVTTGWADVRFADAMNGWLIGHGDDGLILATRDGGQTWTPQAAGMLPVRLRTMFWLDERTGWIGAASSTILNTTTGGR